MFPCTSADTKIQPSAGQDIDGRIVLCDLQEIMPGQNRDQGSETNPAGPCRKMTE